MNFDDPSYAEFVRSQERYCHCCHECIDGSERPCAGVLAGGVCDQACRCDDDDRYDNTYEWEDEL